MPKNGISGDFVKKLYLCIRKPQVLVYPPSRSFHIGHMSIGQTFWCWSYSFHHTTKGEYLIRCNIPTK